MNNVKAKDYFVSGGGGKIAYVRYDDQGEAETLMECAIPAGRVSARPYVTMCPPGAVIEPLGEIALYPTPSAYGAVGYGEAGFKSGANPDFVARAMDPVRQLEVKMNRVMAQNSALASKVNSLQRIDRIPQAPKQEASPAEEPKDEPVVE